VAGPAQLTLWGTRGSIPTPGPGTAKFGGNTPCLTIDDGNGHLLVLDAGTGIRALGQAQNRARDDRPVEVTILLTHTHWDHIQGLPFYLPQFRRGDTIRILGPAQPGRSLSSILRQQMEPGVFPVPVEALHADLKVEEIGAGPLRFEGFGVAIVTACHPGVTYGYSFQPLDEVNRLIYLTDNELGLVGRGEKRTELVRFLRGASTLVHDAMYFGHQIESRRGWGHSCASEAVELAAESECKRLVLFHHDPDHDDQALERLLAEANSARQGRPLEILMAREGESLTI
jgi:ribonuclease BN (tRNA processing enzyme)